MTDPSARPPRPALRSDAGAAVDDDPVLARPAAGRPVVAFLLATLALTAAGIGQATSTPEPAPPLAAAPRASSGDGVREVGVDILPGTYTTAGPETDAVLVDCRYVERSEPGGVDGIVRDSHTEDSATVELTGGVTYFESRDCQDWVLQR